MSQQEMIRVRLLISGKVQGVFYRAHTMEKAKSLGLRGWVKNLPDGRVEVVCEGKRERVKDLVDWCQKGPPLARVDAVEIEEKQYQGEFIDFTIRY